MNGQSPWRKSIGLQPDECLQSVAIRLAPRGLVTVAELLELGLGMGRRELATLPERDDAIRKLALIGGFELEDLNSRGWRRTDRSIFALGSEMPNDWFVTDRRRVAPGRLTNDQGSPWVRMLWQVRALPCDLETGEFLVDHCECGAPLMWAKAETVWGCAKCGRDVRDRPPIKVLPEQLKSARELGGFFGFGDRPQLPPPFDMLSDRNVFIALNWLGYFTALEKQLKPGAANALRGYEALKQWPTSFERAIKSTGTVIWLAHRNGIINLISCIRRLAEPEVEAVMMRQASEILGVPFPVAEPPEVARNPDELFRVRFSGVKLVFDRLGFPADHFVTSRKAVSRRR